MSAAVQPLRPAPPAMPATSTSDQGGSNAAHISPPGAPYSPHELQARFVGMTARDVYALLCKRAGCKVVSGVAALLPDKAGVWDVTELDLSRTYVGHRGAVALVELCKLFDGLRSLSLSDNYLTNKSVWFLCKMAAHHPSLQSINVSQNDITWTAGMCLLELAAVNPRIVTITVTETPLKPKVLEAIAAQLRRNSLVGTRPVRRGHCPTNHPVTVRQRSLKRFFRDMAAKEAGGHSNVGARDGRVSKGCLIDGHRELMRLCGREQDGRRSEAFFDALVRRASGETIEWEEFCLLVMLEDVTFDATSVERLRTVFHKYDTDQGGYVMFSDLEALMTDAYGAAPTSEELSHMRDYYGADDAMTMTWDEFLLLFYDHGPTVGRLSSFHTHTPLKARPSVVRP